MEYVKANGSTTKLAKDLALSIRPRFLVAAAEPLPLRRSCGGAMAQPLLVVPKVPTNRLRLPAPLLLKF